MLEVYREAGVQIQPSPTPLQAATTGWKHCAKLDEIKVECWMQSWSEGGCLASPCDASILGETAESRDHGRWWQRE